MNNKELKAISKLMSLALRHNPGYLNIELDRQGWVNSNELLKGIKYKYPSVSLDIIEEIVAKNDKKRFAFNDDHSKIRANQGHSLQQIDLGLRPVAPPEILYHGTTDKYLESIQANGLCKQKRQHVHLSENKMTALAVGSRHGKPLLLQVNAIKMHAAGYDFFLSENKVWLTDHVPSSYIKKI